VTFEVLTVLGACGHILGLLCRMSVLLCAGISFIVVIVRDVGFDLQFYVLALAHRLSCFVSKSTALFRAYKWACEHALALRN
jgi:hypothetical protein